MLDILFQPDWKISNGTLNGPIVTSTHILEHSWGPRTRTPGLSRRRTVQKFSFVCGAGYHRFKTPKFSQSKLAGMNYHLSETTAITFWSWNCYIIPFRWATYLEIGTAINIVLVPPHFTKVAQYVFTVSLEATSEPVSRVQLMIYSLIPTLTSALNFKSVIFEDRSFALIPRAPWKSFTVAHGTG